MRVLIGCERSGVIRDAFRDRGHDAWSMDLAPAEDGSRYHIQDDLRVTLDHGWDLMIAHPECRYLSSSGLHWNTRRPGRVAETDKAIQFVRELWSADIPRICIENPQGCINTRIPEMPKPQYIQPYQFGHDASKKTGLWLKNLPDLIIDPAQFVEPRMVCDVCKGVYEYGRAAKLGCPHCGAEPGLAKPRWANQTNSGQNRLAPSETRSMDRARTYEGIAAAMAEQWGS